MDSPTGSSGDPVAVATFAHRHEAEMALGFLEDAGISGFVQSDDALMGLPPMSSGSARVLVSPEEASAALEVLEGEVEIPSDASTAPVRRLDEAGGRVFAYGLAALALGVILVVIDLAEARIGGAAMEIGTMGWIGTGLAVLGAASLARSALE